jgi:hypothetical protein
MSGRLPNLHQTGRHWALAGAAALMLLTLAVAAIVVAGFDGLYGQDAFTYHDRAQEIAASIRARHVPPPALFPDGYPTVVAVLVLLGAPAALAAQLTSLVAGVLVVLLTFLLGRDLLIAADHDPRAAGQVGVLAALIMAASGQMLQWSITVMGDTVALAWALLACWAIIRYGRTLRNPRHGTPTLWLMLAAGSLAQAASTRYLYGLLVVALIGYWLWVTTGRRRAAWRHLALAGLIGLVVAVPQLVQILRFPDQVVGHSWLRDWSPLNAIRTSFTTPSGAATYDVPVAAFYARAAFSPRSMFPLLSPLLLVGAWAVVRDRLWAVGILIGAWLGAVYLFLVGIPFQNFRFALTLLPPLAILAGLGLQLAWARTAGMAQIARATSRGALVGITTVGLLGGVWYSAGVLNEFTTRKQHDLAVVEWVDVTVPRNARLVAFGLTATAAHYTDLEVLELYVLTELQVAALPDGQRPTYVLVDLTDVERRWTDLPPGRHLETLREAAGLQPVGELHGYTLFRLWSASGP